MIRAFHIDTKFCPGRNEYVNYLASIESSDCIQCGTEAQIFSEAGRAPFRARRAARGMEPGTLSGVAAERLFCSRTL